MIPLDASLEGKLSSLLMLLAQMKQSLLLPEIYWRCFHVWASDVSKMQLTALLSDSPSVLLEMQFAPQVTDGI